MTCLFFQDHRSGSLCTLDGSSCAKLTESSTEIVSALDRRRPDLGCGHPSSQARISMDSLKHEVGL